MKLQRCEMSASKFLMSALAACIVGLVVCPFAFIAIGALSGFSLVFSFIALPPLLASSACLLYRFLSAPSVKSSSRWWWLAQIVSWMFIFAFLVIISGFTLLTIAERFGLLSSLFLVCSLLSLPFVIHRETALRQTLQSWPQQAMLLLLVVILLASFSTSLFYALATTQFL